MTIGRRSYAGMLILRNAKARRIGGSTWAVYRPALTGSSIPLAGNRTLYIVRNDLAQYAQAEPLPAVFRSDFLCYAALGTDVIANDIAVQGSGASALAFKLTAVPDTTTLNVLLVPVEKTRSPV